MLRPLRVFITLSDEQKNYICGRSNRIQFSTERYLIERITKRMYLQDWNNISENLIANSMQTEVVDGFYEACQSRSGNPNAVPTSQS